MFPCTRCGSHNYCKNSASKGRQRYRCRECHYNYTWPPRASGPSHELLREVIGLFMEGLRYRAIGRAVGYSGITVKKWIEEFRKSQEEE